VKILYSLPHPADRLSSSDSGHTVRANALLNAMEQVGHEVIRLEAAESQGSSSFVVSFYRNVVKKVMPAPIAMRLRDRGRIRYGRAYANRLIEMIQKTRPDLILETHIAFSLASNIASATTAVPYMLDDVAPSWEEANMYGVGLKEEAVAIHRQTTRDARLLVAVNNTMKANLLKDGLPEEKIVVVENGIDGNTFHLGINGTARLRQWNIDENAFVIVFVGSFQPYHRVDLLLNAFARMKAERPLHLLLVGEGSKSAEARALAQQLGLMPHVTFTGSVPYAEVPSYLAAGDVTVMPATNDYGNPMKIYEYMALGKPVVAPDQPTITEIIRHGHDGYLFERENVNALADALLKLVNDSDLCQRLGKEAARSAENHTWLKRAEKLTAALAAAGIG
jgi:glycosyltransferase involved in cell wall biosynthesis